MSALAEIVRGARGIGPADTRELREARVEETLQQRFAYDRGERPRIGKALRRLLGLDDGQELIEQGELFSAWRVLLERLAEERPIVLVSEEVQLADQALLDFIGHLREWGTGARILVFVLSRPDPRLSELSGAGERIELQPLSDAEMDQLVAGTVDGAPDVLLAGAVLGERFTSAGAAAVAEMSDEVTRRLLDGLVAKAFLELEADADSAAGRYAFVQGVVRRVTLARASRRELKRRHLAAVEHLLALTETEPELATVLAGHLVAAVEADPRASDVACPVADESGGLEDLRTLPLVVGQAEEALATARESATVADECGDYGELAFALGVQGSALQELGRPQHAIEVLGLALPIAEQHDPRHVAPESANLAVVLASIGRYRDAAEQARQAVQAAERTAERLFERYARLAPNADALARTRATFAELGAAPWLARAERISLDLQRAR